MDYKKFEINSISFKDKKIQGYEVKANFEDEKVLDIEYSDVKIITIDRQNKCGYIEVGEDLKFKISIENAYGLVVFFGTSIWEDL